MDWSDDVAYSVHDVEDGVASGRIDLRALRSAPEVDAVVAVAADLYAADLTPGRARRGPRRGCSPAAASPPSYDGSRADLAALKDMTSRLIGHLLAAVEDATRDRHGTGPLTRYRADLVIPDGHPGRVRRAQGGRRPLRDVRPRAAGR